MKAAPPTPPRLAAALLRLCLHEVDAGVVLGDLEETYHLLHRHYGPATARRWYWKQTLRSIPLLATRTFYWSLVMLTNYVRIALRHFKKQKGYAFINIVGLAVGLAFCALIFLFVRDELTFDQFHEHNEQIYRVLSGRFNPDGSELSSNSNHPVPLGPALHADLPDVEAFVRFKQLSHFVRSTGEAIEESILYADPQLFEVFSFPLRQGNPTTALGDRHAVVLSERAAQKYFGDENPLGQTLQIRLDKTYEDFIVRGIAQNVPGNSTIQFDILVPFSNVFTAYARFPSIRESWSFVSIQTYVKLARQASLDEVQAKLPALFAQYYPDAVAQEEEAADQGILTYRLQPLTDIHLTSNSNPIYSYILSGIALAILFIACINFMTLAIGRSARRSKEIGIRKVVGAQRRQLMGQFWGEAMLMSVLSLLLGLLLAELFLPVFNTLSGKTLRFDYARDWITGTMLVGLVLFTGLAAGSYPALLLSGFKPLDTLTNRLKLSGSNIFTKSLVVVQFALSVFLLTSTLIMTHQFDYARTKNPGFNKEQIVIIPTQDLDGHQVSTRFREMLQQHTRIEAITATNNTLGNTYTMGTRYKHEGKTHTINVYKVETNFLHLFGLDLIQGRNFNPNLSTDSARSVIVNEALVRDYDMTDPIGQPVPGYSDSPDTDPVIIGVVKDFHFQSLYKEIGPMMLTMDPEWDYEYLLVRIKPTDIPATLALLRTTWQTLAPDVPFEYRFLSDHMQQQYQTDQRWGRMVRYASLFAILIACLGLFGLAALTVTGRTKEIGIRKVLGAPVLGLTVLLSKDFVKLVVIGVVVATPVAYLVMQRWLDDFAYRVEISWWIFLMAGLAALGIALATVSAQTIRAALGDPVKALRYE